MRKLGLTLALLSGTVIPAAAQSWQPEIGIRAGFTRFDDPNSDAFYDVIDLPMVGGFSATNNPSGLYAIIPMKGRMAIQPTFGFYNLSATGLTLTGISAGARLNFAITPAFYVAAGPNVYIIKQSGTEDTQGAIEGAVGYRRAFGEHFRGSLEAYYEKREQSELLPEFNLMGLRVGMGYALAGGAPRGRTGRPAAAANNAMWRKSVTLSGGWTLASFPGSGDITTFTLPFAGQVAVGGSVIAPGPSAFSMIFPMGEKMALEPSLDVHRFKIDGSDPVTTWQVGARLNYAFNRSAYLAGGVEFSGVSLDGLDDGSRMGGLVAGGFRFPLVAGLMGRTELNYRVFDGNDVPTVGASGQATSFVFGVIAPID
jgi:hypothetical protein